MPEVRHAFVPMPDGVRLHATLYVPEGAGPWPAILEVLPYRKDDLTARTGPTTCGLPRTDTSCAAPTCAAPAPARACRPTSTRARSGTDLVSVIGWLATQDWSNGTVGMYGTSYSGFNSIQVAMSGRPR